MTTMGDRVLNISLPKIGEKALFTKDLEDALHSGRVDFVVHSLKDLPTVLPPGMAIGAILEREDPRDALVLRAEHAGLTLQTLPAGSVVGTSSLRRGAQLARKYPHLVVNDIRGNLNTRLAKLDAAQSKFAGIVLAQAGLERMGWRDRISQTLEADDILYAVGQGALAVECRSADARILSMLQRLCCLRTQCRILTERSFLKTLGGGCSAPVAVITELRAQKAADGGGDDNGNDVASGEHELHITGAVWSLDGSTEVQSKLKCALNLSASRSPIVRSRPDADSEDSDDVVPAKRARLSRTPEPNGNGDAESSSPPQKPASPVVVDDTPVVMPSGTDMSALLRIHGDLLTKCPFAAKHQANGDAEKCPLNVVRGQDVMGQCPYLSAEQMVLAGDAKAAAASSGSSNATAAATDVMAKCPVSAADRAKLAGCPFVKATAADVVDKAVAGPSGGCPFLKKSLDTAVASKLLSEAVMQEAEGDSPLQNEAAVEATPIETTPADESVLFCGLFRHECYAPEWFERCEQLGRQLAKTLIENGALAVMECAQLEIRKGI